jgi:hypothetical protein
MIMIKGNAQVVCPFAKGGLLCNRFRNASLVNSSWTPGYFIHVSITTPIASALKNYYINIWSFLVSRSPNGHFKPLLDPGGGFTSETVSGVKRPLRNRNCFGNETVTN